MGSQPSRYDLDPGGPIRLTPRYFAVWIEMVRTFYDPDRNGMQLNSRLDCYPIINRYYQPVQDAQTPPNPSVYLSKMKEAGCLRCFSNVGDDFFWEPVTEITIEVGGEIVYVGDDLEALLYEETFNKYLKAVLPKKSVQAPEGASDPGPGPASEDQDDDPLVSMATVHELGGALPELYEAMLQLSRDEGHRTFTALELKEFIVGTGRNSGESALYRMVNDDMVRMVAGTKGSTKDRPQYRVVFSPYRRRKTEDVIVAPECEGRDLPKVEGASAPLPAAPAPAPSKPLSKKQKRERIHACHVDIWNAAQVQEGEVHRLISKGQIQQIVVSHYGSAYAVGSLGRNGRTLAGPSSEQRWVVDPANFVSQDDSPSAPAEQSPPLPEPEEASLSLDDLMAFDVPRLRRLLADREASFDTEGFKRRRHSLNTQIEAADARVAALRAEADGLEQDIGAKKKERDELDREIEERQAKRDADQTVQDIRWLLENQERLGRLPQLLQKARSLSQGA